VSRNMVVVCAGIVLSGMGSMAAAAGTCECTRRSGDAVWDLPQYKAAFAGRVQSVEEKAGVKHVSFQVVRAWKGGHGKQMTVTTASDACGFTFEQGKDYVVFASGEKNALRADTCGPTAEVAAAAHTVRQLDIHAGYGNRPLKMPTH
jgi:hypothetical protein